MAEVKDKPADTTSSNDLDKVRLEPTRAELRLGSNTLLAQDNPPDVGETRDIVLRVRFYRKGVELQSGDIGGELVAFRQGRIVTAWLLGEKVPEPPSMVTADGKVDPNALWDAAPPEGTFTPDPAT